MTTLLKRGRMFRRSRRKSKPIKMFGDFISMTLVDRGEENGQRSYRYRLEFANAIILQHFFSINRTSWPPAERKLGN